MCLQNQKKKEKKNPHQTGVLDWKWQHNFKSSI